MSEELTKHLHDGGLNLILTRLDAIDARLNTLEDKVERRMQETRPIWEQVLAKLGELENRCAAGFASLNAR